MNLARVPTKMHNVPVIMEDAEHSYYSVERKYHQILSQQPAVKWCSFNDGESLQARLFLPKGHQQSDSRPAVVFLHGGLWQTDSQVEFVPWAIHLAIRGIVCLLAEYRSLPFYRVSPENTMSDANELWRWVHEHAEELGINPTKITLAGSDIGGLMALHAGMQPGPKRRLFRKKEAPLPQPAALALFRGICDLSVPGVASITDGLDPKFRQSINPQSKLRANLPPLFAAHGGKDRLLPCRCSRDLVKTWEKKGNQAAFCYLQEGDHNFYHFNTHANLFEYTLKDWVCFMISQGIWDESATADGWVLS